MNVRFLFLILTIIFSSCGNYNQSEMSDNKVMGPSAVYDLEEDQTFNEEPTYERKLITEGSLSFETKDMASTRSLILKALDKYKGYLSSDQESNSNYNLSNDITVRIPSDKLDLFISEATKGIRKFDHKSINSRDVTDQFLDLSARLKTNKELENRFLEILKKANKVDELLQVERELGRIRAEIESQEGRLKQMNNKIAYSTLFINFYKKISTPVAYGEKFSNGFKNGWKNLIEFFIGIINLWPFLLILIIGFFFFRRWRKNKS